MVSPTAVYDFLGTEEPPTVQVLAHHLDTVTQMVKAYTRGQGFVGDTPAADLAAVIVTATARLLTNPEQLGYDVGGVGYRSGFVGWSLAELVVLNAHRRRTA